MGAIEGNSKESFVIVTCQKGNRTREVVEEEFTVEDRDMWINRV